MSTPDWVTAKPILSGTSSISTPQLILWMMPVSELIYP